jgi:hypothetical protein
MISEMIRRISRKRTLLFCVSGVTIALLVSFLIGELALRSMGFAPWSEIVRPNIPIMAEYHPTFGWQAKEGTYHYSTLPDRSPIQITVLPNGIRSSSQTPQTDSDDRPNIVVVGCSFMFGWAISDQDTLAWKLQEAFPAWHVVNFGTPGYGTYQSLLRMEDALPKLRPDVIVYGFIEPHVGRNVAMGYWLNAVAKRRGGHASMPYATSSQGRLERHGLTQYPSWPGRKYSALITALEKSWVEITALSRTRHALETTQQVLLEMKNLADRKNAEFLIVFLGNIRGCPDIFVPYRDFADANRIPYVDCSKVVDETLLVPGDGHPNEKANAQWFEIVEPAIRKLLTQKSESNP